MLTNHRKPLIIFYKVVLPAIKSVDPESRVPDIAPTG